ncbi:ATP-dependent helicase, partial [bacterium]
MTTNREIEGGQHEALLARAVGLLDRDAIIVANAGAGKTYLLVEHYFALLEAGLEPTQVVAFTFTEKAANELKERIVGRLRSHPGFAELPEEVLRDYRAKILNAPIGTIHQYCLRIIEASRSAGERAAVKIVDEALESALQESVLRAYLRRRFEVEDPDALRLLRRFGIRDLGLILERYLSFLPLEPEQGMPLPPPEEEERLLLEAVERLGRPLWEEIQAQKRAMGWMSFADMERRALELLQKPPETLRQFLQPVAHVLVDEFQDTAPIQIRLVEALRAQGRAEGKRLRLFCVGDPKQSIYRFRDVDRNLLQTTEAEILAEGGEQFDFVVNFRSTPEVLGLVNAFSRGAFPEARDSVAQRPSSAESLARLVEIRLDEDAETYSGEEARCVAEAVASRRGELPLDRIAVLYRASSSAGPLIRELQARGIPYSVRGGQNLFERQEILDLHRLVYFLADPEDDLSLVGVLRSPLFLLSDAALFFLCRRDPERGLWERLQDPEALESLERDFPEEAGKAAWALTRLRRLLALAETRSAHRLIEDWLRREEWGDLYAAAGGGPQALLAIEGYPGRNWVTIGELAEQMQVAHHSAVGLVDRMEAL